MFQKLMFILQLTSQKPIELDLWNSTISFPFFWCQLSYFSPVPSAELHREVALDLFNK